MKIYHTFPFLFAAFPENLACKIQFGDDKSYCIQCFNVKSYNIQCAIPEKNTVTKTVLYKIHYKNLKCLFTSDVKQIFREDFLQAKHIFSETELADLFSRTSTFHIIVGFTGSLSLPELYYCKATSEPHQQNHCHLIFCIHMSL